MAGLSNNLDIAKTIKLYINGDFVRTESGRSFPIYFRDGKNVYAHACQSSRKDLRNAVTAAKGALPGWSGKTAYNRGQILYRMAEMMEGKKAECSETLVQTMGLGMNEADTMVEKAIDAWVYFAGFSDKYASVLGSINPVSGPFHNFTEPEPMGVVGHMTSSEPFDFGRWISEIAAVIVSGNTMVTVLPEKAGAMLAPIAEIFATSDLPKGVVNILSGFEDELFEPMARHMELNAVSFQMKNDGLLGQLKIHSAETMKRVVPKCKDTWSLDHLGSFVEYKTVWHPAGY